MTEQNRIRYFKIITMQKESSIFSAPIQHLNVKRLEIYIETHILGRTSFKRPKWKTTLIWILALIGAAWGISWMDASARAAIIFPIEYREIAEYVFKFGIVATVGADGLWIMLTLSKNLRAAPSSLMLHKKPLKHRAFRGFLLLLLSFASIIAPVYAAFKYNAGVGKCLAIIILVVKFGYSLFGYSTLLDKARLFWNQFHARKDMNKTHSLKEKVLNNCDFLKKNITLLSEFSSGRAFIHYIFFTLPNMPWLKSTERTYKSTINLKKTLQGLAAFSVGAVTFTVDTFIITEAIEKIFSIKGAQAFPFAIIAALPTFSVMTLSSYRTLGEWLSSFSKDKNFSILEQYYPTLQKIINTSAFLLACLAPTAAAYITHDTLSNKMSLNWIWTAVFFMSTSRILFAYFSLKQLLSQGAVLLSKQGKTSKSKQVDQSTRLLDLQDNIQKMSDQEITQWFHSIIQQEEKAHPSIAMYAKQESRENINLDK